MRRLAAIVLMILPVCGQAEGIWTTMSGDDIRLALSDRTLTYEKADQTFYASGKTLYVQQGQESWGNWRVDNNRYCSEWPPQGLWVCYHMDRSGHKVRFIGKGDDITVGTYRSE